MSPKMVGGRIASVRFALVYDSGCGTCTRFRRIVEFLDANNKLDYVPLIEADELGMLSAIPLPRRHRSFHLVASDGDILSGSEAVPRLIELLPSGRLLAAFLTSPIGNRVIRLIYTNVSRLHDSGSCTYHETTEGANRNKILEMKRNGSDSYEFLGFRWKWSDLITPCP